MSNILAKDVQAQWRRRAEQGAQPRQHKSKWVIDKLRDRLPPEHVSLAQQLLRDQALAEGQRPSDYNRVDRTGNSAEGSLIARLDAQRKLVGFERAAFTSLKRGGMLCFRSIIEGDTLAETIRRCGYATGSDRRVSQLVQLTMWAAYDYDELIKAETTRWNETGGLVACRA